LCNVSYRDPKLNADVKLDAGILLSLINIRVIETYFKLGGGGGGGVLPDFSSSTARFPASKQI
jgi:hypothetical protein